jgi:hypothetical protein
MTQMTQMGGREPGALDPQRRSKTGVSIERPSAACGASRYLRHRRHLWPTWRARVHHLRRGGVPLQDAADSIAAAAG